MHSSSSSTALLGETMDYGTVIIHYLEGPVNSTQDETKRVLSECTKQQQVHGDDDTHSPPPSRKPLAVLAAQQNNGRGTQGRTWDGSSGNVYLTVAIPMDQNPVTLTLLPLQVGVFTAHLIAEHVPQQSTPADSSSNNKVTVKWPNDVLVNGRKIAGVLIENWVDPQRQIGAYWLLIGIGINVAFAPTLPSGVRPAICLQKLHEQHGDPTQELVSSKELGTQLALALTEWADLTQQKCSKAQLEQNLIQQWTELAEFGQIYTIRDTGEDVRVLAIESDGRLRVQGANGQERLLVADYLH